MYWPTTYSNLNGFNRLLDEMNRLWGNGASQTAFPKVNAHTNEDGMVITMELPGIDPDALDIQLRENQLTISGKIEKRNVEEGERYHRNERRHGSFSRQFTLPFRVQADKIKANSSNGVLALTLPKVEEEKPRKIAIQVA